MSGKEKAGTRKGEVRVGTSGFSYEDWKGPFYPEKCAKGGMLSFYAERFDTVEINATYYVIPGPRSVEGMIRKAGEGFEFTIKAHQDMTHNREKAADAIPRFLEALKPLVARGKLGCVLLQFPYSFHNNPVNRDFLRFVVEKLAPYPVVIEFRNRDWIDDRTIDLLRELGAGFCCVDEPRLRGLPPPIAEATSDVAYVRFHGRNSAAWWTHEKAAERYDYIYKPEELAEWVPRIHTLSEKALKVFVFFNNHVRGQAPANARMLKEMLGLRSK